MSDILVLEFVDMIDDLVLQPIDDQEEIDLVFAPVINAGQSNKRFTWNQTVPLNTWTVPHNLNAFPSVTVVDTLGDRVGVDVHYVDANIVQISFGSPQIGRAFLN